MTIYVLIWRAPVKNISLEVEADETVLSVKVTIQEMECIPTDRQILGFDGTILEDNRTLSYYGIQNGSQLLLIIAQGHGMYRSSLVCMCPCLFMNEEFFGYKDCRKSTGNKFQYVCMRVCTYVPLVYHIHEQWTCLRDTPTSHCVTPISILLVANLFPLHNVMLQHFLLR